MWPRLAWAFGLVGSFLVGAQGCVSYPEWKRLSDEHYRLGVILHDAERRIQALEADLAAARGAGEEDSARAVALRAELARLQEELGRARSEMHATWDTTLRELQDLKDFDIPDVVVDRERGVLLLEDDVLFDSGKTDLKARGKTALTEIARVLNTSKYEGQVLRIDGHTDTDPIRHSGFKDNWHLGFERARAVGLFLMAKGVQPGRLSMVSHGPFQPRASAKDKAAHRRVEITILPE